MIIFDYVEETGIYVRGYFGNWYMKTKEEAVEYAVFLCSCMTGVKEEERLDVFNEKYIKGYKVSKEEFDTFSAQQKAS